MAEIKVVELQIKTSLEGANNGISKLKTGLKETSTEAKKAGQSVSDISKSNGSISSLGDSLGQLSPAFGNASKGANTLITKMWLIVSNPLGAVIVAIVGAVTLLFKAFTSTKDGADQLSQVMAGLSSVVDVVRDRILNVGNAIVKFFSGDFKGALEEGKKAVSGFGDEVASEFKKAANATKDLQQVEDSLNALSVSRAKVNRDLAISKELLTDENASYAQKKKALDLIKTTEGKQTEQELANARKKFEAIKALNALSDTSRENKKKEQDAEAALFSLQEQSARDRRAINKQEKTLLNQKVSDEKEAAAAIKTINEGKKTKAKEAYEADKTALTEKLKEEGLNFQQRRDLIKADLLLTAEDRKKFNAEVNKEEQKSIDDHNKSIADLNKRYDDEKANRLADTAVKKEELDYNRKVLEIKNLASTKLEKDTLIEKLDAEHKLRLATATKTDADKATADAKANADAQEAIDKKLADSKIQNLQRGSAMLGQISDLVGKNTAAGKVAAVASATIDTYSAAQSAFKNAQLNPISIIGPAYPYISAGLAIAGGLKNVQSILAVKTPSGGGGGSAPSGGGMGSGPTAPAFNVVGASSTNQLAQTIGSQQQQPIKAYVVANDVTTQQGLDRNIVQSASIG